MKISKITRTEQKDEKKPKGIKVWIRVWFKYLFEGKEREYKGFWSPSFKDIADISMAIGDAEEETYPQKDGLKGREMMKKFLTRAIDGEDIKKLKKEFGFIEEEQQEAQNLKEAGFSRCGNKECDGLLVEYEDGSVGFPCRKCGWTP